ncbi:cyclic GMP-AMP synthase-like [Homalodisca vitripennis]|uniref:cyclic GMP-AMP synthase-like n=1 Tax=Homalodisca vitripennis TaxID=197043 RepID=UPI001EECA212|nr:cyclic GMP-AMP synthase-like [Homalodisca vitripennis]XP_046675931.1 cyclic GMP-AMP synthase-like [Homalodisca vitripennis]XP_046675932.1 cyclic GMP-AMP synthase-like [Homalodisca vitripennis]XP_046675933.1 cyclic GMP-AMP synthase-like [Homalodisca vitripennis]XP_046675934.1 cyclic GMP-AMP synthase-like [Homalodisca vitripennis]XP_046675935.1 cyclic GMP-AMP synthase-like [Homalodisca vitripennis]XP_046675936.1 cyclic GMP-AMP synthase-like [Homalodisca vitripennis]XP_046675937.1 cyclic GMP
MADILGNGKYDILNEIIERIHKDCVRMDEEEKKYLVSKFTKVLENFIEKMRDCDSTFNQIFCEIGYTGSFYDGVRVGEATEFDLNLILKPKLKMLPDKKQCDRGFVKIKIIDAADCVKPINDWIVGGFLNPANMKKWLEGVITKTLNKISNTLDDCQLKLVKSGPAMTLKVTFYSPPRKEISIDLVPVIEFPGTMWPPIPEKPKKLLNKGHGQPWFAVPKEDTAWRMSFHLQERYILLDLKYLKYTLRLLKKVRDELQITKVASYYIKTLFLWEVEYNRDYRAVWSATGRGRLFMHMLVRFREALRERRIPFFLGKRNEFDWSPERSLYPK